MFLPAVFFFVTALAAMIADTPKCPLAFPVPSIILVSATFIVVVSVILSVRALVSFIVG